MPRSRSKHIGESTGGGPDACFMSNNMTSLSQNSYCQSYSYLVVTSNHKTSDIGRNFWKKQKGLYMEIEIEREREHFFPPRDWTVFPSHAWMRVGWKKDGA